MLGMPPSQNPRPPRPASSAGRKHKGPRESLPSNQVAHTLTACTRCRQRKTRCDAQLPRCGPCEKNDASCEYYDAAKGKTMPRSYVVRLQEKVRELERQLGEMAVEPEEEPLDMEVLVRGAGLVKIKENMESRYLGPSSGIAMTRLVMELAKELCHAQSIKEIIPETLSKWIKEKFADESSKPTSKVYPLMSFVAAPDLPSRELTAELVENFNAKAQIYYPVLHEPSFWQVVDDVYRGDGDAYKNFTLRMVIALSMQKTGTQWAGLADSYYLAALRYLEDTIRPLNLGTLQGFALIAEYSMTTPTRTAAYWVVGLATKLLQDLRMTDEATIACDNMDCPLDAIEVDLRRRLFWVIGSMELGLAHSLGRPSAFSFTHDHPDVQPFFDVDDRYITPAGVMPGSPSSLKKRVAIHFMKMRFIQLEVRRVLYMKKRPSPLDDSDPWFTQMEAKIHSWMDSYPKNNDANDFSEIWFKVRYHTMIVFLFRPSPQVPEPSARAARLCFDASKFNIYIQRQQIESKTVDMTWIFAQQLFMALNSMLWALSYAEIRQENPKLDVRKDLQTALDTIGWAATKWPGVESAYMLYTTLVEACLKAYDGDSGASYGVASPMHRPTAASPQSVDTPPPLSTPSTAYSTIAHIPQASVPQESRSPQSHILDSTQASDHVPSLQQHDYGADSHLSPPNVTSSGFQSPYAASHSSPGSTTFDPNSFYNPLPSPLVFNVAPTTSEEVMASLAQDRGFFLDYVEEEYPQYLQYRPQEPIDGINLEQQVELMRTLELYGLGTPPEQRSPQIFNRTANTV